jgi:hypothetical protein
MASLKQRWQEKESDDSTARKRPRAFRATSGSSEDLPVSTKDTAATRQGHEGETHRSRRTRTGNGSSSSGRSARPQTPRGMGGSRVRERLIGTFAICLNNVLTSYPQRGPTLFGRKNEYSNEMKQRFANFSMNYGLFPKDCARWSRAL